MDSNKKKNSILRSIAESIVPFDREKDTQMEIAMMIIELLQESSQYSPSETKISGNIGRKTTIISSEVELVVFLYSAEVDGKRLDTFLCEVIDDYKILLETHKSKYPVKDITCTSCSLQFSVRNIKFNLMPAIDFIGEECDALESMHRQQQATLDVMAQNLERNVYRFSASLAFTTSEFMKKQSSFAHDMVRLAKFWYKSARIGDYVAGASNFMELVAVHVVNQMQSQSQSHCEAFSSFLKEMMNFDCIDIVFPCEYDHLENHEPQVDVPLPRLIDPANPYNNIGKHFANKLHVMNTLKAHAQQTWTNLNELIATPQLELFNFIDLFDPVLFDGVKMFKVSPVYKERAVRSLKDVAIRSQITTNDRKKIEFIQLCMSATVNRLEKKYGYGKLELQIEALIAILTKKLKEKMVLASHEYAHEDFDARVFLKTKHSGAIRFSFDVDGTQRLEDKEIADDQFYSENSRTELKLKNASTLGCNGALVV